MSTSDTFQQRVENAVRVACFKEFPHMRTPAANRIAGIAATRAVKQLIFTTKFERRGVRLLTFFDLPRELRDQIYEYVVCPWDGGVRYIENCEGPMDHTYRYLDVVLDNVTPDEISAAQPPITSVSRQLRTETLPLFYRLNEFCTCLNFAKPSSVEPLQDWLRALGTENLSQVRQITIYFENSRYDRERDDPTEEDVWTWLQSETPELSRRYARLIFDEDMF